VKTLLLTLAFLLALLVTDDIASCTTHTYILPNGRFMICTTCCYGGIGSCTTTCF